ncbi:hypothetical protein B0H10DRAFT_2184017 [Mycena sp. CBHHK59/15]|nr:hypothetical protein B0H10DRAFT_2184017 [Mycena sp. CBHHK59/15]
MSNTQLRFVGWRTLDKGNGKDNAKHRCSCAAIASCNVIEYWYVLGKVAGLKHMLSFRVCSIPKICASVIDTTVRLDCEGSMSVFGRSDASTVCTFYNWLSPARSVTGSNVLSDLAKRQDIADQCAYFHISTRHGFFRRATRTRAEKDQYEFERWILDAQRRLLEFDSFLYGSSRSIAESR